MKTEKQLRQPSKRTTCRNCKTPVENTHRCSACAETHRKNQKLIRRWRKAEGRCLTCARPIIEVNPYNNRLYAICRKCRFKSAARCETYRQQRKQEEGRMIFSVACLRAEERAAENKKTQYVVVVPGRGEDVYNVTDVKPADEKKIQLTVTAEQGAEAQSLTTFTQPKLKVRGIPI
jgi:hypothetical protein